MSEGVDLNLVDTIKEICKENPEIAIKEYFNYIKSKEIVKNNIPLLFYGEGKISSQYQVCIPSELIKIIKLRQEKEKSEECILFYLINKKKQRNYVI